MLHVQTGENLRLQGKCLLKKDGYYAANVDSKCNNQETTQTHVIIPKSSFTFGHF